MKKGATSAEGVSYKRLRELLSSFTEFDLSKHLIAAGQVGSVAYNTHLPSVNGETHDHDIMGVIVPPVNCILGLTEFSHWAKKVDNVDITLYDFRKFLKLCLACNPTALQFLWLQPNSYILLLSEFEFLIKHRHWFSAKRAFYSYTGSVQKALDALLEAEVPDHKADMHVIRQLRMINEFLRAGELQIYRTIDADNLRDIRKGAWDKNKVYEEGKKLLALARREYELSQLPEFTDREAVETYQINVLHKYVR